VRRRHRRVPEGCLGEQAPPANTEGCLGEEAPPASTGGVCLGEEALGDGRELVVLVHGEVGRRALRAGREGEGEGGLVPAAGGVERASLLCERDRH
jgi:hypothetical protein